MFVEKSANWGLRLISMTKKKYFNQSKILKLKTRI